MAIKVWEYLSEYAVEKKEILAAIEEVLDSGWLILGEKVKNFESAYAAYLGVRHGIGVANGTDSLILALKALNIGTGDEVITVANTAIPTVAAIAATGARPVFVDIERHSYLMDVTRLEKAITPKTKCIIPVHLFGQCVDMDAVNAIAARHGIPVMEDCAQSHGAQYKGRMAGAMSLVSSTSFYPTKILGTYGDGGMLNTSSDEMNARLRRLRYYGAEKTYYALELGYNSRLDELHASILLSKMKHLAFYIDRRRAIAAKYRELLADSGLILPVEKPENYHTYYLYVVRHPKRDLILEELKKRDIHLNISYPWPIHTMTGYQYLGYKEGDLPETEAAAKEIFSLPMYPYLTEEAQFEVATAIKEILRTS